MPAEKEGVVKGRISIVSKRKNKEKESNPDIGGGSNRYRH